MKKVLVIDDQQDNLTTIKAVMKSHIHSSLVLTSLSGKEGIEIAKKEQPDTILLDIIMPVMDGYEVCRILKSDNLTKHIPILLVTAIRTDSQSRIKGLNMGADAFLSKPIDPAEFTAQVNVMLRIKEAEDKLREEKKTLDQKVKERTKELSESEISYRGLFNSVSEAIYIQNRQGRFVDVNECAVKMYGHPKEYFIGKTPEIISAPGKNNMDSIGKAIQKAFQGEPQQFEFWGIRKNGEIFPKDVRLSKGIYFGQEVIFALAIDITERKRAEQIQKVLFNISNAVTTSGTLKDLIIQIQKELGKIINTANFHISLYDKSTDRLSFPYYADEKDKFTSVPAAKTLAKYVIETQKPLLANGKLMENLVKQGLLVYQGSLSKIWLGVPLKFEGEVTGVIALQNYTNENAYNKEDMRILEFVSDQISISIHRKEAEEDLRAALVKATESDRLKTAFLQNVSHEIRTPMNGILGFAGLLKEPGLSSEDQQEYINLIEISGERMLNTVGELVDISKIEAGIVDVIVSETNVNEQMEEVFNFFKHEAKQKGLQLLYKDSITEQQALIETDDSKLHAILANLVKNAIKYTKEGSIEFGCKIVTVVETNGRSSLQRLQFYVKDTGIGIPKERQEAIFDRFVRADIENKNADQGIGLGLSISKSYVEMLGGKIWVEERFNDDPEKTGSVFYFTLPYNSGKISEPTLDEALPLSKSVATFDKCKILIVEDDEVSEMFLTTIIKSFSKEILLSRTGAEAIETCQNHPDIDLIFMDIGLPDMNGNEVAREIRKFNKEVIIIAETAYALAGDREKAIEAGCNDYISKPIKKNELINMIGRLT